MRLWGVVANPDGHKVALAGPQNRPRCAGREKQQLVDDAPIDQFDIGGLDNEVNL
jgi:hypothetical protein